MWRVQPNSIWERAMQHHCKIHIGSHAEFSSLELFLSKVSIMDVCEPYFLILWETFTPNSFLNARIEKLVYPTVLYENIVPHEFQYYPTRGYCIILSIIHHNTITPILYGCIVMYCNYMVWYVAILFDTVADCLK